MEVYQYYHIHHVVRNVQMKNLSGIGWKYGFHREKLLQIVRLYEEHQISQAKLPQVATKL